MSAIKKIQNKTESKHKPIASHLRVVKGLFKSSSTREDRIAQFWFVCHAAFWNTQQFSNAEVRGFKKLISEHFKHGKNPDTTFKELTERVCLAKRYVTRQKGRYISKPADWLNIHYKNGLAGTASWFRKVEKQRKTVPHYNEGIALLAKAVYRFCKTRNIQEAINYRKELIRTKQYDLLQLYMNCILHIQYFNF